MSRKHLFEGSIPQNTIPSNIFFRSSSDGSLYPQYEGPPPHNHPRQAYAGVGEIWIRTDVPPSLRARYSYGGRTPSPFNIEKPASAHPEAEGVRDAIKITPYDIQLAHYLDAFCSNITHINIHTRDI